MEQLYLRFNLMDIVPIKYDLTTQRYHKVLTYKRITLPTSDQATDLFDVIRDYTYALDTLDAYDYQSLKIADTTAPERFHATYENAIEAIQRLKEKYSLPTPISSTFRPHFRG